ncbi:MAG: sulfatase-like hydrolase/transferase [Chloroflexi bacterium]|nr:sulfatase-like hydrolase/transferase [Chloroflexota bacterium]
MQLAGRRPNFLVLVVDEERYPPRYETEAIKAFRRTQLAGRNGLREHAVEFHRHYVASTACAPSRASIFTGHYPSLHGVTQTDGIFKRPWDPDMFWLDPDSVPTMGDYFRAAGYRTFYKGKWHISRADIVVGARNESLATCDTNGKPAAAAVEAYLQADRLNPFGFSGWVGPEPHGKLKSNAGLVRDPGFAQQTIDLLERLEVEQQEAHAPASPWLVVCSFVNPHDIVLFGLLWLKFRFAWNDSTVPDIPPAATRHERLGSKPRCQQSYVDTYGKMLMPQPSLRSFRRLYYYLIKLVDAQIGRVHQKLRNSAFYENTIVVFTSDHGDLLGAHGGMHQKWHNAYEESIHVPLLLSNPLLFEETKPVYTLTSHVDLLPTMLGLAGQDPGQIARRLKGHSQSRPLVGRNLADLVLESSLPEPGQTPVYFMTDDEISEGLDHRRVKSTVRPIVQPNHVEAVLANLGESGDQLWKYARYFDNRQFWSTPGIQDEVRRGRKLYVKREPEPDEFELYNLDDDPLEENNLAHDAHASWATRRAHERLERLLADERIHKRLVPAGAGARP